MIRNERFPSVSYADCGQSLSNCHCALIGRGHTSSPILSLNEFAALTPSNSNTVSSSHSSCRATMETFSTEVVPIVPRHKGHFILNNNNDYLLINPTTPSTILKYKQKEEYSNSFSKQATLEFDKIKLSPSCRISSAKISRVNSFSKATGPHPNHYRRNYLKMQKGSSNPAKQQSDQPVCLHNNLQPNVALPLSRPVEGSGQSYQTAQHLDSIWAGQYSYQLSSQNQRVTGQNRPAISVESSSSYTANKNELFKQLSNQFDMNNLKKTVDRDDACLNHDGCGSSTTSSDSSFDLSFNDSDSTSEDDDEFDSDMRQNYHCSRSGHLDRHMATSSNHNHKLQDPMGVAFGLLTALTK